MQVLIDRSVLLLFSGLGSHSTCSRILHYGGRVRQIFLTLSLCDWHNTLPLWILLSKLSCRSKGLLEWNLWLGLVSSDYIKLFVHTARSFIAWIVNCTVCTTLWSMSRLFGYILVWINVVTLLWLAAWLVHLCSTLLFLKLFLSHCWYKGSCGIRTSMGWNMISFGYTCPFLTSIAVILANDLLSAICFINFNIHHF